ncbi:MAG: TetR/AcrR family transcriptional regulator [Verrucomicrobiales bacterium]|nr:TetR/AcrR family transcriptional regulator [Verrucomicrobiales bacterium]
MGRKNLSAERSEQILDAFESCIAKHGLEASTLDMVATEAGVKRSLIRHYLGNRDDALACLVERMIERERAKLPSEGVWKMASSKQIVKGLIDELFGAQADSAAYVLELFKGLWLSSAVNEKTRMHLKRLYREYFRGIEIALLHAFPKAKKTAIRQCAYALLCLSDGHRSMDIISVSSGSKRAVRAAAEGLVEQLAVVS